MTSPDPAFDALLTQTVGIRAYLGEGAYGPTYGPAVVEQCRLEDGNELIRSAAGDEVVSSGRLYLLPGSVVTPESLVDVAGAPQRTVLAVERVQGLDAVHHLKARLR